MPSSRFIGDTADEVLNQLIDTTIAKDKDLVAWRGRAFARARLCAKAVPRTGHAASATDRQQIARGVMDTPLDIRRSATRSSVAT